jgi:hypothetical protein
LIFKKYYRKFDNNSDIVFSQLTGAIMKYVYSLLVIATLVLVSACGEKAKEVKDLMEFAQKAPEMGKQMENAQAQAEQRWNDRKQKGDTLALNFKELQKYLPASISGYTAEVPGGESVNMAGMSFSQASIKFAKPAADGSTEYFSIDIMDYNAQSALFSAASFWWISGFSREDGNGFERGFDPGVKDCYGFEKFTNSSKEAEITLAVGYRFIVQIKADNQTGTDFAKGVIKSMNLSALAGM